MTPAPPAWPPWPAPPRRKPAAYLQADTPADNDPELLDQLPIAAAAFTSAPDRIKEALLTAFDIQASTAATCTRSPAGLP